MQQRRIVKCSTHFPYPETISQLSETTIVHINDIRLGRIHSAKYKIKLNFLRVKYLLINHSNKSCI